MLALADEAHKPKSRIARTHLRSRSLAANEHGNRRDECTPNPHREFRENDSETAKSLGGVGDPPTLIDLKRHFSGRKNLGALVFAGVQPTSDTELPVPDLENGDVHLEPQFDGFFEEPFDLHRRDVPNMLAFCQMEPKEITAAYCLDLGGAKSRNTESKAARDGSKCQVHRKLLVGRLCAGPRTQ